MELVKRTKEHRVYKKRNGRYCVKLSSGRWAKDEEKWTLLAQEKLASPPKSKKTPPPQDSSPEQEGQGDETPES